MRQGYRQVRAPATVRAHPLGVASPRRRCVPLWRKCARAAAASVTFPRARDEKAPLSPSFDAAVRARWDRGPITDHSVFGRRSGAPIAALHAHLTSDNAIAAFAAQLELMLSREPGHDETELRSGRADIAAEARVSGDVGAAIAFLIGSGASSDATARPCAMALAVAALEAFGVCRERGIDRLACRRRRAPRLATTHRDGSSRCIPAAAAEAGRRRAPV